MQSKQLQQFSCPHQPLRPGKGDVSKPRRSTLERDNHLQIIYFGNLQFPLALFWGSWDYATVCYKTWTFTLHYGSGNSSGMCPGTGLFFWMAWVLGNCLSCRNEGSLIFKFSVFFCRFSELSVIVSKVRKVWTMIFLSVGAMSVQVRCSIMRSLTGGVVVNWSVRYK